MKDKIITALGLLDSENDNHWTADGFPKLEPLRFSVGSNVTRDQVDEVAPAYKRDNRVFTEIVEPTNESPFAPVLEGDATDPELDLDTGVVSYDEPISVLMLERPGFVPELSAPEMTDEQLEDLREKHSEILQKDSAMLQEFTALCKERAVYLSLVAEEVDKRNPPMSSAEALMEFRARMAGLDQSKLAVNKPRQIVRQPVPLLKG